jgi:hypothetical protein
MSVCLVMITKNESARLAQFLPSVRKHISRAAIYDTGSTATEYLATNALLCGLDLPRLVEFGHFDGGFGGARTRALALGRRYAAKDDWLLMLDAGCWVEGELPDLDALPPEVVAVHLRCTYANRPGFSWFRPQLFRATCPVSYVGRCHEYATNIGPRHCSDSLRIVRARDSEGYDWRAKSRFYLQLLEQDLAEFPDNPRTVFYLANTWSDLGEVHRARCLWEQRWNLQGFEEERYISALRLGRSFARQPGAKQAAEAWLAKAMFARPHRSEAYIDRMYLTGEPAWFTRWQAQDRPAQPDVLFCEVPRWPTPADMQRLIRLPGFEAPAEHRV